MKAGIRYGYMRYWKRERLRNHREIHIPDRITEDGEVTFGMDIFSSGENIADMIMTADEEQRLRARLVWALGRERYSPFQIKAINRFQEYGP